MHKRLTFVLIISTLFCISLPAVGTIDFGEAGLESSLSSVLEGTASSDGSFSLSFTPDFTVSNLSFQLDLKVKGTFDSDPFDLQLDFSDWKAPERESDQDTGEYLIALAKQYSSFVKYIQWGERYDRLYMRYGKLSGITLGDGAIINGFYDTSVSVREARPGLDIMLDGSLFGLSFTGFEFLTTDIFSPTLVAWRIYARPLVELSTRNWYSDIEVGVSYASSPNSPDSDGETDLVDETRDLVSLDAGIPFLNKENLKLVFFSDLLLQSPDTANRQPGIASRYGIWGHWKSLVIFNTSMTIPHFGTYYTDYFDSDFEEKTNQELEESVLSLGTTRLDTQIALNMADKGAYVTARVRSDYANGIFSNYRFSTTAKIDKRLFNIVSLDLLYEKLYPTDTGEGFFEGLTTLRNVQIGATAVVNFKPYSFDIGLSMVFDEEAELSLEVDTSVRIALL